MIAERTRASVRDADALMLQRANVVHAIWGQSLSGGYRMSLTLKRWGKYEKADWTLAQLQQLRHDLQVRDRLERHFVDEARQDQT